MPAMRNASLYTPYPFYYRDVKRLVISYETDLDPVLDILPDVLDPISDPPQVFFTINDIGFNLPLGPYREAFIGIKCKFQEMAVRYYAYMWVTSDAAMAAGREIYGAPKKLAEVSLSSDPHNTELIQGAVERPAGVRLITASAMLDRFPKQIELKSEPAVLLKIIPDACNPKEPAISELLRVDMNFRLSLTEDNQPEFYPGVGSLDFNSDAIDDSIFELIPRKILSASFMKMEFSEEKVTLLHKY